MKRKQKSIFFTKFSGKKHLNHNTIILFWGTQNITNLII